MKVTNSPKLFVPNFHLRSVRRNAQGGFLMRVVAARPIKKGRTHISIVNIKLPHKLGGCNSNANFEVA